VGRSFAHGGRAGASGGGCRVAFRAVGSGNTLVMSRNVRNGRSEAAKVILVIADLTAVILGLWILFSLLDANRANDLVSWVRAAAGWLAGWSHDLFTMDPAWVRTVLNYGLPAVIYVLIGHFLAARISRV